MFGHTENRDKLLEALNAELVGPVKRGKEIECSGHLVFETVEAAYGPWVQRGSGEEILTADSPTIRYGMAVLYPIDVELRDETDAQKPDAVAGSEAGPQILLTEEAVKDMDQIGKRAEHTGGEHEDDDFDLSSANARRPSSMALSFLVDLTGVDEIVINFRGGRYRKLEVQVARKTRTWWLREPVTLSARFDAIALVPELTNLVTSSRIETAGLEGLQLEASVYSRPYESSRYRLLTACLTNWSAGGSKEETSVFQTEFSVEVAASNPFRILPYPDRRTTAGDPEDEELALLYRDAETYAIGHGCAADWAEPHNGCVKCISAKCLPTFETPSITPDIRREDGSPITVSMSELAAMNSADDFGQLEELVKCYQKWISDKTQEAEALPGRLKTAALRNLGLCSSCARRMKAGINHLKSDRVALRAFCLANEAILLQQLQSRGPFRRAAYDPKLMALRFSLPYREPDLARIPVGRGMWRAFQIAFLLMNVAPVAEPTDEDRETVELIWFPTGGGKTEAYLGLTAYATFLRRLKDRSDVGVNVIMRYTLRLLTAQQFQRAASLICAMEVIRRRNKDDLGDTSFSIGIWLGGSTTPNRREDAVAALRQLNKDSKEENPFIITKCPWCGAELGVLKDKPRQKSAPSVIGYELHGKTVKLRCPDSACLFSRGLPVYVVDEDIYDERPSLVIGTVDKFAMLAWRPEARALFGIDGGGQRVASPPSLIIQDELHLISGPLGSIVGLYEMLVEYLCTDFRNGKRVPPKIVCSTATIRRYKEQIKALYARERTALFPPPGISATDSFFARYARHDDGSLCRGRLFVGINAPGHGSIQTTQVRVFTPLLQAAMPLSDDARDPWWTLLIFFNSLRELGTTLSLFQSDIPSYLQVIKQRYGLEYKDVRNLNRILELTGRVRSDRIPEAISELEVRTTEQEVRAVDVCLASSIIEVGVDIDRLSLMAVFGQPKSTAQYIQVTGRVGRQWQERPALVVTLYSPTKPRDRSHFEKFRSYHERLYAQVEPTSVTPFSPPAIDRALHAVLTAFARQLGDGDLARSPYPFPDELTERFLRLVAERVSAVDFSERENTLRVLSLRLSQWKNWARTSWERSRGESDIPMLREPGSYATREAARLSWPIPMSMRNVDAECQAQITRLYISDEGGGDVE